MRKTTIGLLVAAAVTAVACSSGSTETDAAADTDAPAAAEVGKPADKPGAKAAGLNKAVRDGKFEFTVTGMKCGATKVGTDMIGAKAQGQFCLIDVTVKNIGKEAQMFDGSSQKAYDAKGTKFSNAGEAEIYANENSATFLNEINPGNQSKGKLVFDVPKGTKLTSLELHDSAFSGGVKVALA